MVMFKQIRLTTGLYRSSYLLTLVTFLGFLSSCVTQHEVEYLQDKDKRIKSFSYSYSLGGPALRAPAAITAVTNSVLATGDWVRFYVEKSGVYRLSKTFLQQISDSLIF